MVPPTGGDDMDFTVGPVQSSTSKDDLLKVVPVSKTSGNRDRRKKKKDRRKNLRDGVLVSLSTREDRRKPRCCGKTAAGMR
jgi:hypothetical protein